MFTFAIGLNAEGKKVHKKLYCKREYKTAEDASRAARKRLKKHLKRYSRQRRCGVLSAGFVVYDKEGNPVIRFLHAEETRYFPNSD